MNGLVAPESLELGWVRGGDAVEFLDGLLSQSVAGIPIGGVARSLLLSPQGKLRAPVWLLRGESRIGIAVDPGYLDRVVGDLSRFRIRVDVGFDREERRLHELWGEEARRLVNAGAWTDDGALVADMPLLNTTDVARVLTSRDLGPAASEMDAAAVRIAVGEPRLGVDVDESTIPQEADLAVAAVDFSKGCYLGQELVARIESRGHVNRRLRGLKPASAGVPGAEILGRDDTPVGTITSIADHARLGTIALAMIRREVSVGETLPVRWPGGATMGEVVALPFTHQPFSDDP